MGLDLLELELGVGEGARVKLLGPSAQLSAAALVFRELLGVIPALLLCYQAPAGILAWLAAGDLDEFPQAHAGGGKSLFSPSPPAKSWPVPLTQKFSPNNSPSAETREASFVP